MEVESGKKKKSELFAAGKKVLGPYDLCLHGSARGNNIQQK